MIEFGGLINMQLMLFLLMGVGFVCAKTGLVDGATRSGLGKLTISVVLPCNILASYLTSYDAELLASLAVMLAVGSGVQLFSVLLNLVLWRKAPHGRRLVLKYATLVSNAGYLGNPMVEGIFGAPGLVYASMYLIPLRLMMWSVGLSYFTTVSGRDAFRKLVTHPCIIATVLGFVLMLTGWRPPAFILGTIQVISGSTPVFSMFIIGHLLAFVPLRSFLNGTNFFYSLIRLVVIPLAVLAVLLAVRPAPIVTGVAVVLAGMPAGANSAILADRYGGDAPFASQLIFVSTLLSMVTVPLLALLVDFVV